LEEVEIHICYNKFMQALPVGVSSIAVRGFRDPSDILRWTPQGFVQVGTDMPGEPIRTYSVYGVRGSSKYPMGKAFPEPWEIDGWDGIGSLPWKWILGGLSVLALGTFAYCHFTKKR
jgi:hypothetical protein